MQNANEDTEWNDILRAKGIIPPKKECEISEDQILTMIDESVQNKTNAGKTMSDMTLDELDELEDSEDERVILEYRKKRIAELQSMAMKAKFGDVREISGQDYVDEVNKAGDDIWVVLHLYAKGIPLCALINQYLGELAKKFPQTKFLRSIAATCIPNFPEKNLPSIFIYYEGQIKKQFIGSVELRGEKLTKDELEYLLGKEQAITTDIKEDPRKSRIRDTLFDDLNDINDWSAS